MYIYIYIYTYIFFYLILLFYLGFHGHKFNDARVRARIHFYISRIQRSTSFPPFFMRNMYARGKLQLKYLLSTGRIFNIVLSL
jgi:hypothetical protein